jgi:hypothetical protein
VCGCAFLRNIVCYNLGHMFHLLAAYTEVPTYQVPPVDVPQVPQIPQLPLEDILFSIFKFFLTADTQVVIQHVQTYLYRLRFISTFVSLALLIAIIYVAIKHAQHYAKEDLVTKPFDTQAVVEMEKNKNWERVQNHVNSQNANDWKLAILEADVMLDEMLRAAGFSGDTLGERLKNIESGDFANLQKAWEAHKIRNLIAHEGDFQISQREARRIINLYRDCFEEFHFI